ncbi:sulfatase-like hydrolase/transferase [Novipirellula artificiosorum]|uniref:Choline-sulfatase n=1 Tax=Novipirellula artificiosorum TaxID=2528016 RepID=A0A5C6DXM4_9BACT|nr:sulfatase-like hydrolase/transferase [Novipirellula artificiosorum]TWU40587.1 Choline-sulfatase [Novipirellula artificiosorum]
MKLHALAIFALVAFSAGLESAFAEESKVEKPNIVVIFIDDMGFADPSCFGNPLIKTPHIDQLAAEGIKLTNFYVNSPICSASRVALTTGQYQGRWKIHSFLNTRAGNANRGMADYLDASAPTTAKKLKAAGYATAHFGKWHMGGGRDVDDAPLPQAYGFDESLVSFEGLGDRIIENNPNAIERGRALGHGKIIPCERWERMQVQTDRTIDFIQRHQNGPFYVRLFPNDVHDAHVPLPGSADKFKSVSDDPYVRDFFAVLEEMDKHIGRVVSTIDELNLGKKTLILFTSDNGPTDWPKKYATGPPAGFTGPYRGRKWSLFEGGIRMPFIARWTGRIPAGIEDTTSVMSAIDVSPTLCRFAGVPVEDDLDGVNRGDVLLGQPSRRSKPVFWQYGHPHAILKGGKPEHQSPTFAMRDGRWKFLVNPDGSEAQLYDLEADEGETSNLLTKDSQRAAAMAAQVVAWANDLGFAFDKNARLTAPVPTIAILASNQLLRFVNHGVKGDTASLELNGKSWLDLPAFRAPKVAGGRSLQIKGIFQSSSSSGVILAHGGHQDGYSVYLDESHLCFVACTNSKRSVVRSSVPITGSTDFEANWNANGEMFLKVNGKLVGKAKAGIIQHEPGDSIQIGADLVQPVGDYKTPNHFSGIIKTLTFKYPNGT